MGAAAGEDDLPSCSAREALERQEPFINQTLAASALAMLSRLFRYGKLGHYGGFFNAQTGRMSALPIDSQMWAKARRRNRRVFSGGVHGIEGVNFTHESHLAGIRAEAGARSKSESCSGSPAA